MNLKRLTNSELVNQLKATVHECESRLLHAEMGFSSLYEFCTKFLGYSDGAAYRRIQSMRLLKSLPAEARVKTEKKLQSGALSLTNLSLLHGFLKSEKKAAGKAYNTPEKLELLHSIENKSKLEVVKTLSAIQASLASTSRRRACTEKIN